MKKTIAILLILVIGMVGVFAADSPRDSAEVTLTTSIEQKLVIGVTGLKDGVDEDGKLKVTDFASASVFESATKDEAFYETSTDMYEFAGASAVTVAYLHAFSNANTDVYISVDATDFTTEDDELASIPLILTIDGFNSTTEKIKVDKTNGTRTYVMNKSIGVSVSEDNVNVAPASDSYTATITFTIATT